MCKKRILLSTLLILNVTPVSAWVLNDPYSEKDASKKIYYSSFTEQPKTLDPARAYSSNEYLFIAQIYEPPLQYDYYQRPYKLIPLSAESFPVIHYFDKNMHEVSEQSTQIAYTLYIIHIKKGIFYQPHPAFAKKANGAYRYLALSEDYLDDRGISELSDFKYAGTREMLADDFIYQIKRLADPSVESPINGLMGDHIVGFREFAKTLPARSDLRFVDLRQYPLAGVEKLNDYAFSIKLIGRYTQFSFWLAMPFFAPVPWEVDKFYAQPDMQENNIRFDWYPVGTGPFMLAENNPNRRMVLSKNPNFHKDYFPYPSNPSDAIYAKHAGEVLPLIDQAIYTLEKESIPRWNKFLQGYYDMSGVTADSFNQAIQIAADGQAVLTESMQKKKIHLSQTSEASIYYLGFNMLDPLVGGQSERARKLRQAIAIAVNFDESIAIFYGGRGQPAQGPIPPSIFGYQDGEVGLNPYVYRWENGHLQRRPIDDAKKLMIEAGYPSGRDPKTGEALMLHYDSPMAGGPDDKAQLDWMHKQFAKIGIELNIHATQFNRFQEKMRTGNSQLFSLGWSADYPDPENFLFQLYSKNGKVKYGGENASNYSNAVYDQLFERMKDLPNNAERMALIQQMLAIVRKDSPWVWGINPETLLLSQQWIQPIKNNSVNVNYLRYIAIDLPLRNHYRKAWNQPIFWPIILLVCLGLIAMLPMIWVWYRREQRQGKRE